LQSIFNDLGIQALKSQLKSCRDHCASLAREFANAKTSVQRTTLAYRWDASLKRSYAVQLLLELRERQEKELQTAAAGQP
jgi:hypothetical protein